MESRRIFLKKSALTATTLASWPVLSACVNISKIKAKVPMKSNIIRKATVVWYSQTGNTQKCGKVLAKTFENKGITVSYGDMRNLDQTKITDADLIVIGAPVFYYDIPDFVKNFIQSLPDLKGISVAAYVTFGGPEGNQHNAACSILEGLVEKNGVPVGFALATVVDGKAHLDEIDVLPNYGQRGIGTELVYAVASWARRNGYSSLSLITFKHLPWNAPFYEKLGFVHLRSAELSAGLARLIEEEGKAGIDVTKRVGMRLILDETSAGLCTG